MATRKIVPRADNEGGIGTALKRWASAFIADLTVNTIALLGGQIAFPSTESESSDPNTLDDYEEGTFTPTLVPGTSGTITLHSSFNLLSYTKIGNAVTIRGRIVVDSVSSPVGTLSITGLPFICGSPGKNSGTTAVILLCDTLNATASTSMMALIFQATAIIKIYHFTAGVLANAAADVKAISEFSINSTYFI